MRNRVVLSFLAAVAVLGITAAGASAATYNWKSVVTVPGFSPNQPNDLHLTYTGTGGSIAGVSVVPNPGGTTTGVTGGNTVDISWPLGQLPGTVVTVQFTTTTNPVSYNSGTWTFNTGVIGAIAPIDVVHTWVTVPGASPLIMLLIALAMAGAGALMLSRRRAAA